MTESTDSLSPEALELLSAAPPRPPRATRSVSENRAGLRAQIPLFGPRPSLQSVQDELLDVAGRQLRVRVYRPSAGTLPVIVFAHGGGWALGDLDTHDALCGHISTGASAVVISVDFRQPPEHPYPAALQDVTGVVQGLPGLAERLQIDPDRVAVAGDSAGGNLAAVAAQVLPAGSLVHQVLILPSVDTDFDVWSSFREFGNGHGLTREDMDWYLDQYTAGGSVDRRDPRLAPYRAESLAGLPDTTILTAGCDPLRDEGEAYARRLQDVGVHVTLRRFDGMFHPFYLYRDSLEAAKQAQDFICRQLRTALQR